MIKTVITAVALVSLFACAPVTEDIKVATSYDPTVEFSELRTYSWVGVLDVIEDPDGRWASRELDFFAEAKWLIDREMRERGFFEVREGADVGLVFGMAVDMEIFQEIDDPDSDRVTFANIPQGAFFVAMMDTKTLYAVWIGAGTAEVLENPSFETTRKRLDYGVTQIFKGFPPQQRR
jgi:hypothetical protein